MVGGSEKVVEQTLCKKVKMLGGLCLKWPASANAGVPDRIVIIDGQVIFVELKREGGKLSPIQQLVHKQLRERGADVRVIDSVEKAKAFTGGKVIPRWDKGKNNWEGG